MRRTVLCHLSHLASMAEEIDFTEVTWFTRHRPTRTSICACDAYYAYQYTTDSLTERRKMKRKWQTDYQSIYRCTLTAVSRQMKAADEDSANAPLSIHLMQSCRWEWEHHWDYISGAMTDRLVRCSSFLVHNEHSNWLTVICWRQAAAHRCSKWRC